MLLEETNTEGMSMAQRKMSGHEFRQFKENNLQQKLFNCGMSANAKQQLFQTMSE